RRAPLAGVPLPKQGAQGGAQALEAAGPEEGVVDVVQVQDVELGVGEEVFAAGPGGVLSGGGGGGAGPGGGHHPPPAAGDRGRGAAGPRRTRESTRGPPSARPAAPGGGGGSGRPRAVAWAPSPGGPAPSPLRGTRPSHGCPRSAGCRACAGR